MANDSRLPPGTRACDLPGQSDAPAFRQWLDDPENSIEATLFIARFVADYGIELVQDLIDARGDQDQKRAVAMWMDILEQNFEKWRQDGFPYPASPKVKV